MIIKDLYFLLFVIAIIFNIYYFKNKFNYLILILIIIFYIKDDQTLISNITNKSEKTLKDDTIKRIFDNIIKENNKIANTETLYGIYKVPKRFIFLTKNNYILNIIYDLKFLEIFNKEGYYNIIILLEYFLKKYYKMINDEIPYDTNKSILVDIKKNILNTLNEQIYSVPFEYAYKITDSSNKLKSFMNKKIQILFDKNKVYYSNSLTYPIEANSYHNNSELY